MNAPFFILGVPRSGTTLLSVILNNHSKLYIPQVSYLGRFLQFLDQNNIVDIEYNIMNIWNETERLHSVSPLQGFDESKTFQENISEILMQDATKNGKVIWGDKAPPFIDKIAEIKLLFPDSKIIQIIRDPRSNVMSLHKRQYTDIEIAAERWRDLNLQGLNTGKILSDKEYLKIHYEDLLANPEEVLNDVCKFLNVEYQTELISKLATSDETNLENAYVKKTLDTSKIDNWKSELSKKEISNIESLTSPLMSTLGYEKITDASSRRLSSFTRIRRLVGQHTKELFRKKRKVMMGRTIEVVEKPFMSRIKKFISEITNLFFSRHVINVFKKGRG